MKVYLRSVVISLLSCNQKVFSTTVAASGLMEVLVGSAWVNHQPTECLTAVYLKYSLKFVQQQQANKNNNQKFCKVCVSNEVSELITGKLYSTFPPLNMNTVNIMMFTHSVKCPLHQKPVV